MNAPFRAPPISYAAVLSQSKEYDGAMLSFGKTKTNSTP